MNMARVEVTRLQERVDVAKQAKDTEAAVNLGISTKRLLSALDEAEKALADGEPCPARPGGKLSRSGFSLRQRQRCHPERR